MQAVRVLLLQISIHAPVKGATPYHRAQGARERDFNPRAREGRDERFEEMFGVSIEFQSTRP